MSTKERETINGQLSSEKDEIDFQLADRGGKATFHDKSQLMIYPIFNLQSIGMGLKSFITKVLNSLVLVLKDLGIPAYFDKELDGIWIGSENRSKLASVGFRLINRCTDHGIALYVGEVSGEFSRFTPCGIENLNFTSISEIIDKNKSPESFIFQIRDSIEAVFAVQT